MAAAGVLAVASGKGGVGKSLVALNLAVAAARSGRRVLLVDADLGLGDIAILLGISPDFTLEDVLTGRCPAEAAALPGPEGLVVLPAAANAGVDLWERGTLAPGAAADLARLEACFAMVVVDTGAGIAARSLDFVAAADECLLVVTPEPAAIADAYATLKVLRRRSVDLPVGLLVNMAESAGEAEEVCARFQEIARRFLGAEIDNRGYIPLDRYVREAAKRQMPFVQASPPTPAAEAIASLAGSVLQREVPRSGRAGLFARVLDLRRRAGG